MAAEEAVNLSCPLSGQQRTNCIDDAPARPAQLRRHVQEPRLQLDDPVEAVGSEPPTSLRIATPGSAPGAGRVDQDEIRLALPVREFGKLVWRVQEARLDRCSSALRPRR